MSDAFDLERFVSAQNSSYDAALRELRAGNKRSHWMWFVFPQITGLGRSSMAQMYAIGSLDEARAYLAHPVLGPRLRECCSALISLPGSDPVAVLGGIDAVKLRSSMTLFAHADPASPEFPAVLSQYFSGEEDPSTLQQLGTT